MGGGDQCVLIQPGQAADMVQTVSIWEKESNVKKWAHSASPYI